MLFDVDFTLARPGPELGPEGYRRVGERHGLDLDPELYEESRLAALASLQRHPELEHDDELWIAFTERIVRGMGGDADGARACAEDLVRAWEVHERFTLYEDALPALAALREHGVKIGLISNGGRDLDEFVARAENGPLSPYEHATFSAHQMGSCRMGRDSGSSVANPWGELHDTPGVWIGDASAFPSASGVNPMVSIMALSHRTAEAMLAV